MWARLVRRRLSVDAASTAPKKSRFSQPLKNITTPDFGALASTHLPGLRRKPISILQMNIGLYCNLSCKHCHVGSSPRRKEMMDLDTAAQCIRILDNSPSITTVDLTGGAPELNSSFRWIVAEASKRNKKIIDRCNLTVLLEKGQEDLLVFLKDHKVQVVASLPCYSEKNVDKQRGRNVFDRSIEALKLLNQAGYGVSQDLGLDLVYNPGGPTLPPSQKALEGDYKKRLFEDFGITFNSLIAITNMPVNRFANALRRTDQLEAYMNLLVNAYNPSTLEGLMCRDTLNVSWNGDLFDCDFNQQLNMHIAGSKDPKEKLTVFSINSTQDLDGIDISFDKHCFGCTAGFGSSCGGATVYA